MSTPNMLSSVSDGKQQENQLSAADYQYHCRDVLWRARVLGPTTARAVFDSTEHYPNHWLSSTRSPYHSALYRLSLSKAQNTHFTVPISLYPRLDRKVLVVGLSS
jgi:hypothetical protein